MAENSSAGIGGKLNSIFGRNTIFHSIIGFGYSAVISIAPMVVVILAVILMQKILGFSRIDYARRELYSNTVLYVFIFSLIFTTPFGAVLSRYLADAIYNETYGDILPCYYVGLILNIVLAAITGGIFCIREYIVGGIPIYYVFTGYCGFIALTLVFYSQNYLNISHDYGKISVFYTVGMLTTVILSLLFVNVLNMEITYAMLLSLVIGILLIGMLMYAIIKCYYRENSGKYREVLYAFRKHWKLVIVNTMYTLGLYASNFVFWGSDLRVVVAKCFVSAPTYDMATCVAMFTNISASIIFVARVEMYFRERYKLYNEAVTGGRLMDIEVCKQRMFTQLTEELVNLVRIQFIVSVALFLVAVEFLPFIGMGGLTLTIYPCLAAGFFIMNIMYSAMMFQMYLNDLTGTLITAGTFLIVTLIGSFISRNMLDVWYGLGFLAGSLAAWTVAYFRLRYMEKYIDINVFCQGNILTRGEGSKPGNLVYSKKEQKAV